MEDLSRERRQATFDVEAMKIVWAGGPQAFESHQKLASIVANDPVFQKDNRPRLTHKELVLGGIKKAARCKELVLELGLSEEDAKTLRILTDEKSYADLHWVSAISILQSVYK